MSWYKIIQATYKHKYDYWVAWKGGEIIGIFPVTVVHHPLIGTKLVAMPYQMHSGLPISFNENVQIALAEKAQDRARKIGAKYLEIRHYEPAPFLDRIGFTKLDSDLVTTYVPLQGLTFNQIRRGHRRNILSAKENGITVNEGQTLADLNVFWHMYLEEGRQLGAPKPGWKYFENLHLFGRPHYKLFLAWSSGECLGGALSVDDGRTVFGRHSAYSSQKARELYVGKALVWESISDAVKRGCQTFNLGVTWYKDTGIIQNKEGWNGISREVHLYIYPVNSSPQTPGKYFEGFSLAKTLWRYLPLPVVDLAGRVVTRWVC